MEKTKAIFFSGAAAIAGLLFLRMKWAPGVDFDFTGFFWLIANAGRLSVLMLFLVCAAAGVSCWFRAYWEG